MKILMKQWKLCNPTTEKAKTHKGELLKNVYYHKVINEENIFPAVSFIFC